MEKIENAFCIAYKKRSFWILMLMLPPIFLLSMKITGYFQTTIESLVITSIIIALVILGRNLLIRDSRFLKKKVLKAFYKIDQYGEFAATIDRELHSADAKIQSIPSEKIFICITATWFILVTPNGSLICKQGNITKITSTFRETNSKHYLKIILFDEQSFLFPYPELEELFTEWI